MKHSFAFFLTLLVISQAAGQEHPFLLTRSSDYPELRARAEHSPWKEMKEQALSISYSVQYERTVQGPRNKSALFVDVVSHGTLAYILDPDHSDVYVNRVENTLLELPDIQQSRSGNIGDWDSHVPVAAALFNAVLALDILYHELDPDNRFSIEREIVTMLSSLSSHWETSSHAARGIWALYRGDQNAIENYKTLYRSAIENYLTEDGIFAGGTNYAHSRFSKPEREQKFMFMDVLEYTGEDIWYEAPLLISFYEWLFGQTLTISPENSALTFGDSRLYSSHYGKINESPRAYNVHRFSEQAGKWAAWHVHEEVPSSRLTTYLTTSKAMEPERPWTNRIYSDGGAWFFHRPKDGPVLSSALWNTRTSMGHTHKETNAIHLTAYGEHMLVNAGYRGYGNGALGFSWDYINKSAISGNTVLINHQDHAQKHGNGVTEGFISEDLHYTSGHSGDALPNGTHVRNFVFLPPGDDTNGYWVLFDEIAAHDTDATTQVILHAHSDIGTATYPFQSYRWLVNRITEKDNIFLTAFLGTPARDTEVRDGLIANGSRDSFIGKYLYSSYPTNSNGEKNIVTVLFPSDSEHPRADMSRTSGSGYTGTIVEHTPRISDVMLESDGMNTVQEDHDLSFQGRALWTRRGTESSPYFIRKGRSFFNDHHLGFESEAPVSLFMYATSDCSVLENKKGNIVSPGTELTLHTPCTENIMLNGEPVSLEQIDESRVRFFVPDGTYEIAFSNSTQSRVSSGDLPQRPKLLGNHPNPFNPFTSIHFQLSETSYIELTVYDMLGRKVAMPVKQELPAGAHQIRFDASNLPSGIYIYDMIVNGSRRSDSKKMLLLK